MNMLFLWLLSIIYFTDNSNAVLSLSCDGDPYIITKKIEHPTETDILNICKKIILLTITQLFYNGSEQ